MHAHAPTKTCNAHTRAPGAFCQREGRDPNPSIHGLDVSAGSSYLRKSKDGGQVFRVAMEVANRGGLTVQVRDFLEDQHWGLGFRK